jgi:DNA-binding LacI/PurR family transcriptional regulator
MSKKPIAVGSEDVARLAGVSRSAVSRAFTEGAYIAEETKAKVLEAARVLGYRPNAIARGLSGRRTKIIGIVLGQLENPFYAEMLEELTRLLQARGLAPLLFLSDPANMDELVATLLAYQVDGVLLPAATLSSRMAVQCERSGTPVVMVNRYSRHESISSVAGDNLGGGASVAELFIRQGNRQIAYIGGLPDTSSDNDREQGFRKTLSAHGIVPVAALPGYYTHEGGAAAAREMLRTSTPEAIFCANDVMAMAALEVAEREFGMAVPKDLVIAGYDNSKQAGWPLYSLTSVDQNVPEMAAQAVNLLIEHIADLAMPTRHLVVPSKLVERRSTERSIVR